MSQYDTAFKKLRASAHRLVCNVDDKYHITPSYIKALDIALDLSDNAIESLELSLATGYLDNKDELWVCIEIADNKAKCIKPSNMDIYLFDMDGSGINHSRNLVKRYIEL